jgi:hypothetical protein
MFKELEDFIALCCKGRKILETPLIGETFYV